MEGALHTLERAGGDVVISANGVGANNRETHDLFFSSVSRHRDPGWLKLTGAWVVCMILMLMLEMSSATQKMSCVSSL